MQIADVTATTRELILARTQADRMEPTQPLVAAMLRRLADTVEALGRDLLHCEQQRDGLIRQLAYTRRMVEDLTSLAQRRW